MFDWFRNLFGSDDDYVLPADPPVYKVETTKYKTDEEFAESLNVPCVFLDEDLSSCKEQVSKETKCKYMNRMFSYNSEFLPYCETHNYLTEHDSIKQKVRREFKKEKEKAEKEKIYQDELERLKNENVFNN